LLTSDVDMLILNYYFNRDFDKMNLYGPDLTGFVHYPICYIGMKCKKWRELLNIEYGKFNENIIRDLEEEKELALSEKFTDFWFTDQRFITRKIKEFGEDKFNIVNRGHNAGIAIKRIDRIIPKTWEVSPGEDHIDCHLLKEGYNYDNFNKIYEILKMKLNVDLSWMKQYVKEFNEI